MLTTRAIIGYLVLAFTEDGWRVELVIEARSIS